MRARAEAQRNPGGSHREALRARREDGKERELARALGLHCLSQYPRVKLMATRWGCA